MTSPNLAVVPRRNEFFKNAKKMNPTLQEWNRQSLAITQALYGIPSPNFRRVTLDHDGSQWLITFILECENTEDQEEIDDFVTEWDALQSRNEPRQVRTIVTSEFLQHPDHPVRVIYQRRESYLS